MGGAVYAGRARAGLHQAGAARSLRPAIAVPHALLLPQCARSLTMLHAPTCTDVELLGLRRKLQVGGSAPMETSTRRSIACAMSESLWQVYFRYYSKGYAQAGCGILVLPNGLIRNGRCRPQTSLHAQ
jgi:hypothetical protein